MYIFFIRKKIPTKPQGSNASTGCFGAITSAKAALPDRQWAMGNHNGQSGQVMDDGCSVNSVQAIVLLRGRK